jgi:hypothetical protein
MKKYLAIILFILLVMPSLVFADIASPANSITFNFINESGYLPISDYKILLCNDEACTSSDEIEKTPDTGLWTSSTYNSFGCSTKENQLTCSFYSFYSDKHHLKLIIAFADKTRESNTFSLSYKEKGHYQVMVNENSLKVSRVNPIWHIDQLINLFLLYALLATIVIELVVFFIFKKKIFGTLIPCPPKLYLWIILVNVISLPILWLLSYYNTSNFNIFILIAEILIVLFEASFLSLVTRQRKMWGKFLILSLAMNTASFILGSWLLPVIINFWYESNYK